MGSGGWQGILLAKVEIMVQCNDAISAAAEPCLASANYPRTTVSYTPHRSTQLLHSRRNVATMLESGVVVLASNFR